MKKRKRLWALFSALALTMGALSGCGDSPSREKAGQDTQVQDNDQTKGDSEKDNADLSTESGDTKDGGEENTAMGRYVETVTDLSDFCVRVSGVVRMADGSLMIADVNNGTTMTLAPQAQEWQPDKPEWFRELDIKYVFDLSFGADGTGGIIYKPQKAEDADAPDPETEQGQEEENGETESEPETDRGESYRSDARCLVVRPDGARISVELPGSGDESIPELIEITDTGRVFVTCMTGEIYEVKEDGSVEKVLTVDRRPEQIQFQGNIMIMDAERYDGFLLYDLEKGEYVEDEVLHDFVQENYKDRSYSSADCYEVVFFPGEDGVIYIAGEKGLHRHVIGGGAMEQVIDGALSCFGNPTYSHALVGMTALADNEFLAAFYGGKVARFTYNPDIPTVPDERLKVYSLRENNTLRQGVSIYQSENPQVYVEYEVGIGEGDSTTRDDALKKLNTRIMAGEGPDVVILDDMPIDSYISKNMLLDLSGDLDSYTGENALFENIVDAFEKDGRVYTVPCEIQLPLMAGKEKYISMAGNLEGIADMMEQLRTDYPEKPLMRICSEKGIMRFFAMTSAPAWKTASGELDTKAVTEFLKQSRRIYDAQMDGLPAKYVEDYMNSNANFVEYLGVTREESDYFRTPDEMAYLSGETQIVFGSTYYHSGICMVFSIRKVKGFEEDVILPMGGMSEKVFIPKTLIGINAASANLEGARGLMKTLLGSEVQSHLYNGFSINREAFPEMYNINEEWINEEGVFSSIGSSNPDGTSFGMDIYMLSDEQRAQVLEWMETVSTPYIADTVLENAVYNVGVEYMRGGCSLEEAGKMIQQNVDIYMSE